MKKLLSAVAVSAMMVGSALAGEVPLTDIQIDKVTAGNNQDRTSCCSRDTSITQTNTGNDSLNTNSGNSANGGQYVDNSRSR